MVHTLERAVVGDGRMRTARGNAWEAVCADRARADQRAELDRLVAELAAARPPRADRREARHRAAGQLTVGSSPRSSASQASRWSAARPPGRPVAGALGAAVRAGRS